MAGAGTEKREAPAAIAVNPLVLLVEDHPDSREIVAGYLEFCGYRIDHAETGNEALAKAQSTHPDIILMDLGLPGMSGWEVIRALRRSRRTKDIPVIAVTAHALPQEEKLAWAAGCNAFITKPAHPAEILFEVQRFLDHPQPPPYLGHYSSA